MNTANKLIPLTALNRSNASGVKKSKARSVQVSGKAFVFVREVGGEYVRFETMAEAGWVRITSVGNENLYFDFRTDEGEVLSGGYCKCL